MKNVVIAMAVRTGISAEKYIELRALGAEVFEIVPGVADLALARNIMLTRAYEQLVKDPNLDVVLCIDDDMRFPFGHLQKLTERCSRLQGAHSVLYVAKDGRPTCTHLGNGDRWLTGLGGLAIHRLDLSLLRSQCEEIVVNGENMIAWTSCGMYTFEGERRWYSEDYRLCAALGGVHLHIDLIAGHEKTVSLYPSESTRYVLATLQTAGTKVVE